jgi:hypothetical protein
MDKKILELNTKVNVEKSMKLVDIHGKKISFQSDCSIKTSSKEPFYIAIVNQTELDEGKIPFEKFTNPFERRVTFKSEDNEHLNHYIAFKSSSDKEIVCDVNIKLSDIEPLFSKLNIVEEEEEEEVKVKEVKEVKEIKEELKEEDKEILKKKLYEISNNDYSFYRNIAIVCFVIVILFVLLRK